MDNENKEDRPNVQADNNSIAVGGINIGGDISGNITIGHTGYTVEQVSVLLTQITSTFQPKPFDGRCPHKGADCSRSGAARRFAALSDPVIAFMPLPMGGLLDLIACRVGPRQCQDRTVFVVPSKIELSFQRNAIIAGQYLQ